LRPSRSSARVQREKRFHLGGTRHRGRQRSGHLRSKLRRKYQRVSPCEYRGPGMFGDAQKRRASRGTVSEERGALGEGSTAGVDQPGAGAPLQKTRAGRGKQRPRRAFGSPFGGAAGVVRGAPLFRQHRGEADILSRNNGAGPGGGAVVSRGTLVFKGGGCRLRPQKGGERGLNSPNIQTRVLESTVRSPAIGRVGPRSAKTVSHRGDVGRVGAGR